MVSSTSPPTIMKKNVNSKHAGPGRNARPENQKKSKPKLRASGDAAFISKAFKAFAAFQDKPPLKPISELGFCFVKTTLGYLQVDVGWLLMLIGGILESEKHQAKPEVVEIELTDDVLDATVEVLRSVRRYIQVDLLGMYIEAELLVRAKSIKLTHLPLDRPYTVEKLLTFMLSKREKHENATLKFLGDFLAAWPPALLLPEVLETFISAISKQDPTGTKRWRELIQRLFGTKPRRGRRSEELYDILFKKRLENPGLSYGKLAIDVAKAKNIEFTVAREQLKAAIAYRRKKAIHLK
jgi:hypothetical protein